MNYMNYETSLLFENVKNVIQVSKMQKKIEIFFFFLRYAAYN